MRITLIISSLSSAGGAERVMSNMANYWAANGRQVTLITLGSLDSEMKNDFYVVHPGVERVSLGVRVVPWGPWLVLSNHLPWIPWLSLRNALCWIRGLRREIRASHPDVVISFLDVVNVRTLLAVFGLRVPVIVSERIDVRKYHIAVWYSALRRLLYPKAHAVVVPTEAMRQWAETIIPRNKVYTIPNAVAPPTAPVSDASLSIQGPVAVAMGRLVPQKGFDLLLRAFERCTVEHPDWSLMILGEGVERKRLAELARELGIADRVRMPGLVREPAAVLREADIFVLSSRYEGFANSVVEAMACGVPVVSFDCLSGPGEIIRNGVDGVLVPPEDVDALSAAMKRLMSDENERRRLASRAPEVLQRFSEEKVMEAWERLIKEVSG